jgi:hypothetical protein
MEPLFLAVICGCNAGLFREALHDVYIPRIQRGKAYFAAKVLGATGPLLSVLVHFFEHGRWGFLVEKGIDQQSLVAEDQLFILAQAGLYLTATRGLGSPEARSCYELAEPLCHSLSRPLLLYVSLVGRWRYTLMTDKVSDAMQTAKRVYLLAQEQNDGALMVGAYRCLAATFFFLGDFESGRQHAMCGVQIWRSGGVPSPVEEPITSVLSCLCYEALCEWHLGETASFQATMVETIALAKELNDMHALVQALWSAAVLAHFERHPAEVERLASDFIERSTRQNFATWLPGGAALRGWACSASGDPAEGISRIEDAIRDWMATGAMLTTPYFLTLKAEALYLANRTLEALEAVREADRLVARTAERWWYAELHRLRAVFATALGADESVSGSRYDHCTLQMTLLWSKFPKLCNQNGTRRRRCRKWTGSESQ